jgi:hypothetical protein
MILKPALAAMIASGLVVPEAPKLVFPKPAIIKSVREESALDVMLGMPVTMGILAASGFKDPFFSSVVLLHRYNGANASTTFTDEGPLALTSTASGNAQLTTTSPKFGSACLTLDGTGDWVTTQTSAAGFSFGTGDFTIEFWVKSSQTTRTDLLCLDSSFASANWWGFIFNVGASAQMEWYEGGASRISGTSTGWNNGTWRHVAVSRNGTSVRMFLNGTQIGSTYTTSYTYGAATRAVSIGTQNAGTGPLNGQMDNIRITKGVGRYSASFTAPGDFPAS